MLGRPVAERRRKLPEAATLENPPGSESQTEGSMWALPETADFMEKFECCKAWFNTCPQGLSAPGAAGKEKDL